jgi:hypothetical protein
MHLDAHLGAPALEKFRPDEALPVGPHKALPVMPQEALGARPTFAVGAAAYPAQPQPAFEFLLSVSGHDCFPQLA